MLLLKLIVVCLRILKLVSKNMFIIGLKFAMAGLFSLAQVTRNTPVLASKGILAAIYTVYIYI